LEQNKGKREKKEKKEKKKKIGKLIFKFRLERRQREIMQVDPMAGKIISLRCPKTRV
jgi:hypothetical protein